MYDHDLTVRWTTIAMVLGLIAVPLLSGVGAAASIPDGPATKSVLPGGDLEGPVHEERRPHDDEDQFGTHMAWVADDGSFALRYNATHEPDEGVSGSDASDLAGPGARESWGPIGQARAFVDQMVTLRQIDEFSYSYRTDAGSNSLSDLDFTHYFRLDEDYDGQVDGCLVSPKTSVDDSSGGWSSGGSAKTDTYELRDEKCQDKRKFADVGLTEAPLVAWQADSSIGGARVLSVSLQLEVPSGWTAGDSVDIFVDDLTLRTVKDTGDVVPDPTDASGCATIHGIVTDEESSEPIKGLEVTATTPSGNLDPIETDSTDAEGAYELDIKNGQWTVVVHDPHGRYAPAQPTTFDVDCGDEHNYSPSLTPIPRNPPSPPTPAQVTVHVDENLTDHVADDADVQLKPQAPFSAGPSPQCLDVEHDRLTSETNDDGQATFQDVPRHTYCVEVGGTDYIVNSTVTTVDESQETVSIETDRAAQSFSVTVENESGVAFDKGEASVEVDSQPFCHRDNGSQLPAHYTCQGEVDENGEVTLELPWTRSGGHHKIWADAAKHAANDLDKTVPRPDDGEPTPETITLQPADNVVDVWGYVEDNNASGGDRIHASVNFTNTTSGESVLVNATGDGYSVLLKPGTYDVAVENDTGRYVNKSAVSVDLTGDAGQDRTVTFGLDRVDHQLTIEVLDETEKSPSPVSDLTVEFEEGDTADPRLPIQKTTNGDGQASIQAPWGNYSVSVNDPRTPAGYNSNTSTIELPFGGPATNNVNVSRATGFLNVSVVDASGDPIDAKINLTGEETTLNRDDIETGPDGILNTTVIWDKIEVEAHKEGYVTNTTTAVLDRTNTTVENSTELPPLTLRSDKGWINGSVREKKGSPTFDGAQVDPIPEDNPAGLDPVQDNPPIEGIEVTCGNADLSKTDVTDAQGRFNVTLPEGSNYACKAGQNNDTWHGDSQTGLEVTGGQETEATVTLTRREWTVEVLVQDPVTDEPVPNATIRWTHADEGDVHASGDLPTTDEDGHADIPVIYQPGTGQPDGDTIVLIASKGGRAPAQGRVVIGPVSPADNGTVRAEMDMASSSPLDYTDNACPDVQTVICMPEDSDMETADEDSLIANRGVKGGTGIPGVWLVVSPAGETTTTADDPSDPDKKEVALPSGEIADGTWTVVYLPTELNDEGEADDSIVLSGEVAGLDVGHAFPNLDDPQDALWDTYRLPLVWTFNVDGSVAVDGEYDHTVVATPDQAHPENLQKSRIYVPSG